MNKKQFSFFKETPKTSRKSRARQTFLPLETPNQTVKRTDIPERNTWIEETCKAFVSPSRANKSYYRAVLECLWPSDHGIPGPIVSQYDLREVIDKCRRKNSPGRTFRTPYLDPFRRIRELQGEEGITGIARVGSNYQLVSLETSPKRIPRTNLTDKEWQSVLSKYSDKCAVCGRESPEVRLQQDHKIPRLRTGSYGVDNWQPLCDECNNFKSVSCRGCQLDCLSCPWAYPEKYAPIPVSSGNMEKIRKLAKLKKADPSELLNLIIETHLKSHTK